MTEAWLRLCYTGVGRGWKRSRYEQTQTLKGDAADSIWPDFHQCSQSMYDVATLKIFYLYFFNANILNENNKKHMFMIVIRVSLNAISLSII